MGAQRLVIPVRQGLSGLREHRGGDDSPDSWQGLEDGHVTVLAWRSLRQLLQEGVEPFGELGALAVDQAQARQQQGAVIDFKMSKIEDNAIVVQKPIAAEEIEKLFPPRNDFSKETI